MSERTGALRSTLFPSIGPAVAQLSARSQTCRDPVAALPSSVPGGTEVESENAASAGSARPDPVSSAVQAIETLLACQSPSTAPQATTGASTSAPPSGCASANGENEFTTAQTSLPVSNVVGSITGVAPTQCTIAGGVPVNGKHTVAVVNVAVVSR